MYYRIIFLICLIITSLDLSIADEAGIKILKIENGVKRIYSLDELTDEIVNKKIVYIGEIHNNPVHHEVQLEIIKKLHGKNNKIAIGMEMFQDDFQDSIDMFLSGRISEAEFLKNTEYEKRWGFDYEFYKPIIDYARENKIPVVALSVNSEIIKRISEKGLANLNSAELGMLPEGIDFTNNDYREYLGEIFKDHPKSDKSDFNKFYNIQIIWDESMASNINRFLSNNKDITLIVLAGNGHIVYSYGIPGRSYRRNKFDYSTILNDTGHEEGISDYVIYSDDKPFH